MSTNGRSKAMKIGVLMTITASMGLLLFQNCQKPSAYVDTPTSSTTQSSTGNGGNGSVTTTTLPNVSTSPTSYAPIRMDQVCNDSTPEKKALINTYIRLLHRCADRTGLDFWYQAQLRAGASQIANLEAGIRASSEFQNLNVPGQSVHDRFCLSGDTFQILSSGQVLTNAQMDALSASDSRAMTVTCRTSKPQNLTASQSQIVRDTLGAAANQDGGYVCSVPGDALRNRIIELYITYLDRCPEVTGLDFWAKNWPGDSAFINGPDVQGYLNCRYQNGDRNGAQINTIDACYQSRFNTTLCPGSNTKWVKIRWCEKTGP